MGTILAILFLAGAGAGATALVLSARHRRLIAIGERRPAPPAPQRRADPLAASLAAAAAAAAGTSVEAPPDARIADGHGVFGRAIGWGLGIGAASGGLGASIVFPPISTIVGAVIGFCVAVVPTLPAAAWIAAGARTGSLVRDYQQRVDQTCTGLGLAIPVAGLLALPLADGEGWFIGVGVIGGAVAELLLWRARLALSRPLPVMGADQFSAATST